MIPTVMPMSQARTTQKRSPRSPARTPASALGLIPTTLIPSGPIWTSGDHRAATLRKAIPIIALRDEYLHRVGDRLQARSRKAARTYVGEMSAFAICENNPRILQTLVSRLLRSGGPPTPGERVEVIDGIAEQFSLHLRAIEVPNSASADRLPRPLVEKIGRHFEASVLGQVFNPEPPLSFKFVPTSDEEDTILVQSDLAARLLWGGHPLRRRSALPARPYLRPALQASATKGSRDWSPGGSSAALIPIQFIRR